MKCHLELAAWVSATEEITKGDLDRLLHSLGVYLTSCGGVPKIAWYCAHESVCITASAMEGEGSGSLADAAYVRKMVLEALAEAGMEIR